MTARLVGAILERAARALPAAHVEQLDGWRLRHDDTGAWWVSSVQPHAPADPLQVVRVEEFYRRHGAPARFQISSAAHPANLDRTLADRGYRWESPMSLQTAAIHRPSATQLEVRVDDHPTGQWCAVHMRDRDPGPELRMLHRVEQPSGYACALMGDEFVAVGRAVVDTGWAGIFDMATLPHARRRGAAQAILAALAGWAADHRASRLYLQVEGDNTAALRLYTAAGFSELSTYHYRTRW